MREVWYAIRYGQWSCGCEMWEGKPKIGFFREFYDHWHVGFHLGPFWLEVDYL